MVETLTKYIMGCLPSINWFRISSTHSDPQYFNLPNSQKTIDLDPVLP
jgi:hypothetical protein